MLGIIHIDNVTRVLTRDLTRGLGLPCDLLAPLSDLLIVEAGPQLGWLMDLTLQVEEVMEEGVVENTHLRSDCQH